MNSQREICEIKSWNFRDKITVDKEKKKSDNHKKMQDLKGRIEVRGHNISCHNVLCVVYC